MPRRKSGSHGSAHPTTPTRSKLGHGGVSRDRDRSKSRTKLGEHGEYMIGDDGDVEQACEHGVGHGRNVHTCDGCCATWWTKK